MQSYIRGVALFVIAFIIGFYTNAILMVRPPEAIISLMRTGEKTTDITKQRLSDNDSNAFKISFDGHKFDPQYVSVPIGKRIEITNKSTSTLMKLRSNEEKLRTERGYGESERFIVVLMNEGVYHVDTESAPDAKLEITVTKQAPVEN